MEQINTNNIVDMTDGLSQQEINRLKTFDISKIPTKEREKLEGILLTMLQEDSNNTTLKDIIYKIQDSYLPDDTNKTNYKDTGFTNPRLDGSVKQSKYTDTGFTKIPSDINLTDVGFSKITTKSGLLDGNTNLSDEWFHRVPEDTGLVDSGFDRDPNEGKGYDPIRNKEELGRLEQGLVELVMILYSSGIKIKDKETLLSLKDDDNPMFYNGREGVFSVSKLSSESETGLKELIQLLGDNNYSVRELMTSPPKIVIKVGNETFYISTGLTDFKLDDLDGNVESNIEKERKENIKRALKKGLDRNVYNSINFEGDNEIVRKELIDYVVDVINEQEKIKGIFIKNSVIEGSIAKLISTRLRYFEKTQTFITGKYFKDLIDSLHEIVSKKEMKVIKDNFVSDINNILSDPDNFQTIGDPELTSVESNRKGAPQKAHKSPDDNINPSSGTGGKGGYLTPEDPDPRRRIHRGETTESTDNNKSLDKKETLSKAEALEQTYQYEKDNDGYSKMREINIEEGVFTEKEYKKFVEGKKSEALDSLLNFDDKGIESAILKKIEDGVLSFEEIVNAFRNNNKLDKVNWNEVKESIISDILYIKGLSDYPLIYKNQLRYLSNADVKDTLNIFVKIHKSHEFENGDIFAKMVLRGFVPEKFIRKHYDKIWVDTVFLPSLKEIKEKINKVNSVI